MSRITDILAGFDDAREAAGLERILGRDTDMHASQLEPSGAVPDTADLLLSALLWTDHDTITKVLAAVTAEDFPGWWHQRIFEAIRECHDKERTGAQAVTDELIRSGAMAGDKGRRLAGFFSAVITAGGQPLAWRDYVAGLLAAAFRAQLEAYTIGLAEAVDGPEDAAWTAVIDGGTRLRQVRDRLAAAREGAGL